MAITNKYFLVSFVLFLLSFDIKAQEGTRNTSSNKTSDITGKIMIVPFEPKLYMSQIDMKINQQTKWNFEQIRENFRHQLDNQLKLKLQSISTVVSFYTDSTKTWKDLLYTYKSTSLSYDLVDKPTNATSVTTQKSGIKNGQVEVEVNNDKKFMNTKITDNELITYLTNKYKSEYFVFINELDLNTIPDSYDIRTDSYQRELVAHYSIIDKNGKTIAAGLSSSKLTSTENNPKKIVSLGFAPIATTIAGKLSTILNPPKK